MLDSVLRLTRLLDTPRDIPVLAPLALREFHYRLLQSPYGRAIAQMAIAGSNTHKIGQIIRRQLDEDVKSLIQQHPNLF